MKSRLISSSIAACVAILTLFTVSGDVTPTPYTWAQTYGVGSYDNAGNPTDDPYYGSGTDYPVGIAKMPDGGAVVAGQLDLPQLYSHVYISHTGAYADATLVRYGSDGSILWQKTLHQDNGRTDDYGYYYGAPSRVYQVLTDGQGNIFICGGKGNSYNSGQTPFVAKFSSDGNLVWQNGLIDATTTTGIPPVTYPIGIGTSQFMCLTDDGGVLVTGVESRLDQSYTIPTLVKFSASGGVTNYAAYENPAQYAGSFPVAQSKDGTRYVFLAASPNNGYATGFTAVVTNTNMEVLAQRSYDPSNGSETPRAIIATSDGGFATLSWISGLTSADAFVIRKFNSDLSTETFEKVVRSSVQNAIFTASSLVETNDGGFLIGGHSSAFGLGVHGGGYEAALMKLKNDGSLQFVSLLGGPANELYDDNFTEGCDAVPTTDGGYAFTVATYSYSIDAAQRKPDWWVVKTDANRRVTGFEDLMIDLGLDKFIVTDTTSAPTTTSAYTRTTYSVTPRTDDHPLFVLQDPGANSSPNKPSIHFQAAVAGGPPPPPPPPTCDPGMTDCGGVCVNLQTDPQNCGTCGNNCPPGTTCSSGGCVPIVIPVPALSIIGKVTSTSDPVSGHFAHTGDKIDYTLTFSNTGEVSATDLHVSTTIPSYIEAGTNLTKQFSSNQLQLSPGGVYVPASAPNVRDARVIWTVGNLNAHLQNFVRLTIPSLPATVRTEQSLRLPNDYSVYSGTIPPQDPVTGFSSGAPNLETHIEGAIKTTLTAQSATVAPGGQLGYLFKVTNTAAKNLTPPHAIAVMVQPEFTNFVSATVTAPAGATFTPVAKLVYISGQSDPQVVLDLGPLSGGKSVSVSLTFQAQWADPAEVPKISTLDYGASFLPETGVYPSFKAAFTAAKKTPPGGTVDFMSFVTSSQAVATSRQDSSQIDVPLQGNLNLEPLLSLSKSISNTTNGNQGSGNGQSTDFVKPGDTIAFILTGENFGRTTASNVVIQDGLPEHAQFVSASLLTLVGGLHPSLIRTPLPAVLDNQSGHHIRFENLQLRPGERNTIEYTVRVDSGPSAPLAGSYINSDACSIGSSNTVHTPAGRYLNGPIQIIGQALLLAEPKARAMVASPGVAQNTTITANILTAFYKKDASAVPLSSPKDLLSYLPGFQRYYVHYENAGTVPAQSVQLSVPLPAHTVFYRAAFVNLPSLTPGQLGQMPGTVLPNPNFPAVPAGWGISTPAFLSSGGIVTFTFDKLPAATRGDVMVEVLITPDAIQRNASVVGDVTNVTIQDGSSAFLSAKITQETAAVNPKTASRGRSALTVTPIADPNRVPQVGILKTVPERVLAGSTFDVYITIFNKGSYACATPLVNFTVPAGTMFISAEYGQGKFFNNSNSSAAGSVMSFFMASNNGVSYGIEPLTYLDPHTAASIKITLKAIGPAGTQIPNSRTDLVAIFAGDIIAPPTPIDIVGSLTGLVDPKAPGWLSGIVGAPVNQILFNGGAVNLIDLGGNNIVAQGGGNIVAQGAGNIVAQGAGNIVASGAGNLIPIGISNGAVLLSDMSQIVAQGAGNILVPQGNAIVAQGAGNIVAAGAGNIVAQGAGNIVAQGGGNIVAQGAGNAVSLPVAGLVGKGAGQIVAQGAGNIVAQGAGNIVAQGAGNIVAAGAGNIISGNGSAIIASTPDSAAMVRAGGNALTTAGGAIVAQGGGN